MFVKYDDNSIYATRGDAVYFPVEKIVDGAKYEFQPGDIVRIKVVQKKDYSKVVLMKDFEVTEECTSVNIFLDRFEMKIGEIINKPVDYWYEVELNPDTTPDTFIGYNEDGPALFKLFPEAKDVVEGEIPDSEENAAVTKMVVTFVHEYLDSHSELIIKEILKEENRSTIIQEILKSEHIDSIIQEIIKEGNIETIVREILKEGNIETIVQELVKQENIETIVHEMFKEENVSIIVEKIMEEIENDLPADGVTFTPKVDAEGNLSWTNDGGRENPAVVNIMGRDGNDGKSGTDGYTPVRGVDYYTEADKTDIINAILGAMPDLDGVSY